LPRRASKGDIFLFYTLSLSLSLLSLSSLSLFSLSSLSLLSISSLYLSSLSLVYLYLKYKLYFPLVFF
jgi:hypothetical protein